MPQDGRDCANAGARKRPARSVTVNLSESPLAWLHARGHLTDRQFDGGEKLRADWERANLPPNTTMSWNMVPPTGGRRAAAEMLNATEAQIAARQRFDNAIAHLGTDLSDIAWRIICAGEGVPAAEKNLGWPARSGKLVLKIALDRLANFYRLPE
ncbi:DUF6456 domain-containing protein [Sphingorhabdus sp. EL138]|uniref:DUF6456 domain-containing protein n=1 Tax=Sphingorhabdus sp. EL138 TaxID=2073156 RepID=UPI0020B12252|nr:DUF6456 domain-containing protein [Sphingorhabdus sp. EL138]